MLLPLRRSATLALLVLFAAACPSQKVAVELSPTLSTVPVGGTQLFIATVTGTSNHAVSWGVVEGGGGSISATGIYTAPGSPGVFTVEATSAADSRVTSRATVTVVNLAGGIAVAVTPSAPTVAPSGTLAFTANVTGTMNKAVTWSVKEPTGGSISATGMYTAPATPGTYTVVATSVEDSTKTGTAKVTVSGSALPVTIAINPATVTVGKGSTQTFFANVANTPNTAVTWSVEGTNAGTVDQTGVYTAPAAAGSAQVVATSKADPTKVAKATVTISDQQVINVVVNPNLLDLTTGGTQQFTVKVSGTTNTAVTWTTEPTGQGGTITSAGLYTAPTTNGLFYVVATSTADATRFAKATVRVSAPNPVSITVSPSAPTVSPSGTVQLTATVTGTTNTAVTWTATGGTVSATGLYQAPAATGPYTVTATSVADITKKASAIVTVAPTTNAVVTIAPVTVNLVAGKVRQFTATVTNIANTQVNWSVQEPTGGEVTPTGLYAAPEAAGTYHVIATSVADPSKSATATVNVTARTYGNISGTVSYAGTRTGRIYIVAFKGNVRVAGTSLAAPGAFTLRGLPTGSYDLLAHVDAQGTGFGPSVSDPWMNQLSVATGTTTVALAIVDRAPATPIAPRFAKAFPMAGGAVVYWGRSAPEGAPDQADSYRIYWGASPNPGPGTSTGSVTVPYTTVTLGMVKGLMNGSNLYFSVAGVAGATVGPITNAGLVTVGPQPAIPGAGTITGTVAASGGSTAGLGPLSIIAISGVGNAAIAYGTQIPSPTASQGYSIPNVTTANGQYLVYASYDRGDDGFMGVSDPNNSSAATGPFSVPASNTGMAGTTTLVVDGATVKLNTLYTGLNDGGNYSLIIAVSAGSKLPVKAELSAGPGVPVLVDAPLATPGGFTIGFETAAKPNTSTSYSLAVTCSDGTTTSLSAKASSLFQAAPSNLSPALGAMGVSKTPTFSWTAPVGSPPVSGYVVQVFDSTGKWLWDGRTANTTMAYAGPPLGGLHLVKVWAIGGTGDAAVLSSSFTTL